MRNNKIKVFVVADLHFAHKAMLKFSHTSRGHFANSWEMDEEIIRNWNNVVGKNDIVYLLGDVSFSSGKKTRGLIERLNGRIILIKGNHDKQKDINKYIDLLEDVLDYKEINYEYKDYHYHIVMSHYPFGSWNRSFHGSIMCHGHSHGRYSAPGKIFDVGLDSEVGGFEPINIEYIIDLADEIENKID